MKALSSSGSNSQEIGFTKATYWLLWKTQKGAIEIEVFSDGVLRDCLANPGDRVPVGEVIAMLDSGKSVGRTNRQRCTSSRCRCKGLAGAVGCRDAR